ncbi:hypothetical protein [Brevibacillus borstelensis]|uniref:hypothetical protein n=1 Tax=Brevibacillus borstelensis TaxID=45462 RepID=UPI002E1FCD31|nr:hypothetical protein [Brevibacillus borstelensis]
MKPTRIGKWRRLAVWGCLILVVMTMPGFSQTAHAHEIIELFQRSYNPNPEPESPETTQQALDYISKRKKDRMSHTSASAAWQPQAGAAAVRDTFEPNDDYPEAYPAKNGYSYLSLLSTESDFDYYRYDSGTYSGMLTVKLTVPKDKNYDLIVMEGTSKNVGSSLGREPGAAEKVAFEAKAGTTYYFVVFSMDQHFSTTDRYNLIVGNPSELAWGTPVDIDVPEGVVPGYRITAPATGNFRFFTSPYAGTGLPNDTLLLLFEDELMQKLLGGNDNASEDTVFSELDVNLTKGLTYYLYVAPSANDGQVHARLTAASKPNVSAEVPILHETEANDGSVAEQQIITLEGSVFAPTVSSRRVSFNNLPEGLETQVVRLNDKQLAIRFSGKALSHENKDSGEASVTIYKEAIVGALEDVTTNPFSFAFTDTPAVTLQAPRDLDVAASQYQLIKFTPPATGTYEIYTDYFLGNPAEGTSDTILSVYEDYERTRHLATNDDGKKPPFSSVTLLLNGGQNYFLSVSGWNGKAVHARLAVRYLGVEYVYNEKGLLVQMKQDGKVLVDFYYDNNGNLIRKVVR